MLLQKLQSQHHHISDMQEEPIDFSLNAFKKRKQPCFFPPKSQSPSSKRDQHLVSSAAVASSSSLPSRTPHLETSHRDCDNINGQGSDKALDDHHNEELQRLDSNRNDTDNGERWLSPASSVKTSKELAASKANRSRKGSIKSCTGLERAGSVASKVTATHGEQVSIKRAINTFSLANSRHMASAPAVYKTSNGVSFVSQPAEEYEKIECCETRGLKLTFRRRSTEKSQQIVKDKALKPQHDIPKLIVSKCKKAQGYSLHNGKNEKECKCSSGVALEDPAHETEILPLLVSPKTAKDSQPFLSGKTIHTNSQTLKENTTSSEIKCTVTNEKPIPINRGIKDRGGLNELQQDKDKDAVLKSGSCLNEETVKVTGVLDSKQVEGDDYDSGNSKNQHVIVSSCQNKDASNSNVADKKSREVATSLSPESLENTSEYLSAHLLNDNENRRNEKQLFSEHTKCEQHETPNGLQCKEPDDATLCKSQDTVPDLENHTDVNAENTQEREQEQTPSTSDIMSGQVKPSNTFNASRKVKLHKSDSEGWYLPVVDVDASTYSRRSESAPPVPSLPASDCKSTHNISRETSRSKSLENASIKSPSHQVHTTRNPESSLDELYRPSSSPPTCSSDSSTDENFGRKSPVVLLDRLPSPVIELYSMRSSNHSPSDLSESLSDDQVSSGECSVYSEYDSENNVKSSGKLRFTYRKVNRGRGHTIKNKFRASGRSRPSCSRSRDALEKDDEHNVFKHKGKKRCRQLQRRKHYGRASKRRVRYINDDDEYQEDMGDRANADDGWLEQDGHSENNVNFQHKKLNKNTTSVKCGHNDSGVTTQHVNVMHDLNDHHLVDPRIKSMSTALLNACQNNQNADKIAFKGKITPRPLSRNEPQKQRKRLSSQILTKASRAVDNIRKQFSRSGTTYVKNYKDKQHGKQASGAVARIRHSANILKGSSICSLKDVGRHSNLIGTVSYPRHTTIVAKRGSSDLLQTVGTTTSSNKYRNVFESDVFRPPTKGSSESWSQFQSKSQRTNKTPEMISKSSMKNVLKKWAIRRPRGGKSMRLLAREVSYDSSPKARCCKCRCRCQNDDELVRLRLLNEILDINPASVKDSKSLKELPAEARLQLCELEVTVKPECPDEEPETREAPGTLQTTVIKREVTSPPAHLDTDNNASAISETGVSAPVKTEITKDTDLMGLDYSQPARARLCSQIFDDTSEANDGDTIRNTSTTGASAIDADKEHHKLWDTCCSISQSPGVTKDMDPSFLSEQTLPCSLTIDNQHPVSTEPNIIYQASTSTSERTVNFPSKFCDSQIYQISTTTTTTVPTPLYLFTNQVTSRTTCSAFSLPNLPNCSLPSACLPTLTLNTPLSIQIGHSPENSEYGSPPNLTECSSPGYCASRGTFRSSALQALTQFYQNSQIKHPVPYSKNLIPPQGHIKNTPCFPVDESSQKKSTKHNNHSTKLSMTVPRISISSPSSVNSKEEVTPSTASPTGGSNAFFISPDLPRQAQVKSISRSSSPFRSPSTLLSPYKSPTRAITDPHHKSIHNNTHKHTSDTGGSRMKPQTGFSSSNQRNYQSLQIPRIGNRHLCNTEDYESDDSDATLVYPTADSDKKMHSKARISSRRSSIGLSSTCYSEGSCISALSSPSLKDEDRNSGGMSPSDNLERKRSELSLIVSDLRENISKTKAMKRNRRTNSFSGENQQGISDANIASKTTVKRPSFERFMSVEPLMDSDTPYARLTQDLVSVHDEDSKNFDMMRFVSGLHLQPKSRKGIESRLSPDGTVGEQIYCPKYEENECSTTNELPTNVLEEHKYNISLEDASESSKPLTSNISELQTTIKQDTESNSYNTLTADNGDDKPDDDNDDYDDDDDNTERPLVVIENAESDEVIEGDEAFHKMSSGTYNLPTGTVKQSESRSSKSKASFRVKRLRISMKSLFTRKTPKKSKSVGKSNKEACCKHAEKSRSPGYKIKKRTDRNSCHLHQNRAQRKKRAASTESAHDSQDAVCGCKHSNSSALSVLDSRHLYKVFCPRRCNKCHVTGQGYQRLHPSTFLPGILRSVLLNAYLKV